MCPHDLKNYKINKQNAVSSTEDNKQIKDLLILVIYYNNEIVALWKVKPRELLRITDAGVLPKSNSVTVTW